jgi:hypothetical protein
MPWQPMKIRMKATKSPSIFSPNRPKDLKTINSLAVFIAPAALQHRPLIRGPNREKHRE